jgi:hypothetical protein
MEMASLLQQFARVVEAEPLARPDMAKGLLELSRFLKRHGEVSIREALSGKAAGDRESIARRERIPLRNRLDIAELDGDTIGQLLDDPLLTKEDLVDIAVIRFGISRSRLIKENRTSVAKALRASLHNREALEIIGREAARVGSRQNEKWQ